MSHPSFQHAYVEERKIVEYLLSSDHERGKSKAFVFRRRGFSIASWHEFANALRLQALKADVIEEFELAMAHVTMLMALFKHVTDQIRESGPSGKLIMARIILG